MQYPVWNSIPYQTGIEEEHKIQKTECKKALSVTTASKLRNICGYSPKYWWLETEVLNRGSESLRGAEKGQHKQAEGSLFTEDAVQVQNSLKLQRWT